MGRDFAVVLGKPTLFTFPFLSLSLSCPLSLSLFACLGSLSHICSFLFYRPVVDQQISGGKQLTIKIINWSHKIILQQKY